MGAEFVAELLRIQDFDSAADNFRYEVVHHQE